MAHRTDATQRDVVEALRGLGCQVSVLSEAGRIVPGLCDLLVRLPSGRLLLVECKTGAGKLTPAERAFAERFPVEVVRSADEALALVTRALETCKEAIP